MPAADTAPVLLACLAALLVGLSKGGLPIVGMLAVPVLALALAPVKAAALLLPIFILTDVVGLWLYHRVFSKPNLKVLVPAALAGVVLGWRTAAWMPERLVGLLIGLLGLAFLAWSVWGPRWKTPAAEAPAPAAPPWPRGAFWGVMAGFTSFVAHAGAPPFQMHVLPQRLPKLVYVGTSTILFSIVNAAKLPAYIHLRPYTEADLMQVAAMAPAALVGTALGAWATKRLPERGFYRLVQGSLLAVSLKLVWDALKAR